MNLTSGKFTAPRDGRYSFSFTGNVWFPASSTGVALDLSMYLNGNVIGRGHADEVGTVPDRETFSFQTIFNLQAGDQIWLQILNLSTETFLFGSWYTQFSGMLLEENISQ